MLCSIGSGGRWVNGIVAFCLQKRNYSESYKFQREMLLEGSTTYYFGELSLNLQFDTQVSLLKKALHNCGFSYEYLV